MMMMIHRRCPVPWPPQRHRYGRGLYHRQKIFQHKIYLPLATIFSPRRGFSQASSSLEQKYWHSSCFSYCCSSRYLRRSVEWLHPTWQYALPPSCAFRPPFWPVRRQHYPHLWRGQHHRRHLDSQRPPSFRTPWDDIHLPQIRHRQSLSVSPSVHGRSLPIFLCDCILLFPRRQRPHLRCL